MVLVHLKNDEGRLVKLVHKHVATKMERAEKLCIQQLLLIYCNLEEFINLVVFTILDPKVQFSPEDLNKT